MRMIAVSDITRMRSRKALLRCFNSMQKISATEAKANNPQAAREKDRKMPKARTNRPIPLIGAFFRSPIKMPCMR